jgi:hypothetical protein
MMELVHQVECKNDLVYQLNLEIGIQKKKLDENMVLFIT